MSMTEALLYVQVPHVLGELHSVCAPQSYLYIDGKVNNRRQERVITHIIMRFMEGECPSPH